MISKDTRERMGYFYNFCQISPPLSSLFRIPICIPGWRKVFQRLGYGDIDFTDKHDNHTQGYPPSSRSWCDKAHGELP